MTSAAAATLPNPELVQPSPKASPSRAHRAGNPSTLPVLLRKSTTPSNATTSTNNNNDFNSSSSRLRPLLNGHSAPSTSVSLTNISGNAPPTPPQAAPVGTPALSKFPPRSLITHNYLRFLIADCPSDSTLHYYIQEFQRQNVQHVVRVCQPTYDESRLIQEGIQVHDMPFKDGELPSTQVISQWLKLVVMHYHQVKACYTQASEDEVFPPCIAVHCVAGLGRAPVLVVIALIEFGCDPVDAVESVRKNRPGALNKKQIRWLMNRRSLGLGEMAALGGCLDGRMPSLGARVSKWLGLKSSSAANSEQHAA